MLRRHHSTSYRTVPIASTAAIGGQLQLAIAAVDGDHPALIDGETTVSYRAYAQQLRRIAAAIQAQLGVVGAPRPIISFLPHRAVSLVVQAAVLSSGHILVPQVREQGSVWRRAVLDQLQPALIVSSRAMLPLPPEYADAALPVLLVEDLDDELRAPLDVPVPTEQDALIYFTSGSTGRPRGVRLSHQTVLGLIRLSAEEFAVTPDSRLLHAHADVAVNTLMAGIGSLCCGATVIVASPHDNGAAGLPAMMRRHAVTHASLLVPLMRALGEAAQQSGPLSALRFAVTGGEVVRPEDLQLMRALLPPDGTAVIGLGATEVKAYTRWFLAPDEPIPAQLRAGGWLRPGFAALIVDEECHPLPPGREGEIVVISDLLASGYLADEFATAARFIPAPDGSGRRAFRTGDRGRICADGWLEYLGRLDEMVKIRGHRVELGAVHLALNRVSLLREGTAVAVEMNGQRHLLAYIVWRDDVEPSPLQVRAELLQYLPDSAVPTRFVVCAALPRGINGKVLRTALPPPTVVQPLLASPYCAPTDELQRELVHLWQQQLALAEIGIDDDFFALGGDSLTLFRLLTQVEREHGAAIDLQQLTPVTIRRMAELLNSAMPDGRDQLPPPRQLRLRHVGPLVAGRPLPYAWGHRLLQLLIALSLLCRRDRQQPVQIWRAAADAAGIPFAATLPLHLAANRWTPWRVRALHPVRAAARWVTLHGFEQLQRRPAGQGLLLVTTHSALGDLLLLLLRRRLDADLIVIDAAGGRPSSTRRSAATRQLDRSQQLLQARRRLEQGGVVLIAGDGRQGRGGVDRILLQRRVTVRSGAAELAISAGAWFVPVFITMTDEGRVTVESCLPLISRADEIQRQIRDLTEQYADLLAGRFPALLPTYASDYLRRLLRAPTIPLAVGSSATSGKQSLQSREGDR